MVRNGFLALSLAVAPTSALATPQAGKLCDITDAHGSDKDKRAKQAVTWSRWLTTKGGVVTTGVVAFWGWVAVDVLRSPSHPRQTKMVPLSSEHEDEDDSPNFPPQPTVYGASRHHCNSPGSKNDRLRSVRTNAFSAYVPEPPPQEHSACILSVLDDAAHQGQESELVKACGDLVKTMISASTDCDTPVGSLDATFESIRLTVQDKDGDISDSTLKQAFDGVDGALRANAKAIRHTGELTAEEKKWLARLAKLLGQPTLADQEGEV